MLSGSIVALATPFREDGSVNFDQLGEWIEFQIAGGTDGILVLGTTGESSTMSHEEDDGEGSGPCESDYRQRIQQYRDPADEE